MCSYKLTLSTDSIFLCWCQSLCAIYWSSWTWRAITNIDIANAGNGATPTMNDVEFCLNRLVNSNSCFEKTKTVVTETILSISINGSFNLSFLSNCFSNEIFAVNSILVQHELNLVLPACDSFVFFNCTTNCHSTFVHQSDIWFASHTANICIYAYEIQWIDVMFVCHHSAVPNRSLTVQRASQVNLKYFVANKSLSKTVSHLPIDEQYFRFEKKKNNMKIIYKIEIVKTAMRFASWMWNCT